MNALRFFQCMHCGNIAAKLLDRGPALFCCGDKMVELEPNTTDAAGEKHVPVVTREGQSVTVVIGQVEHPMQEDHYIEFICLHTTAGVQMKYLKPGDEPRAEFFVPEGAEVVEAFEHCNKHGLWKA